MSNFKPDAGIPVLTEVISIPEPSAPGPVPFHPAPFGPTTPASVHPVATLSPEQWDELERDVREHVLQQVMKQIDFVLEQRVRDSLADVLQTAVEGLAADIRSGLHATLKDVVTHAVMHEISSTKSPKNHF